MATNRFGSGIDCARALDANDELARFRRSFHLPKEKRNPLVYLCGHSLGLMPKRASSRVRSELDRWAKRGAEGHFGKNGWMDYHRQFAAPLAELIGAGPDEVVAMNTLTVNLHLMMVSFFRPGKDRKKILIEQSAFPSDRYAVRSQLEFHGLDPEKDLIEWSPSHETGLLQLEHLDRLLEAHSGRVALILLPGVQYLTGQALDIGACVDIARRHGCTIGFDLAHAIGNLPLSLHRSGADFAVWCSYKYLNGGPGAVGGCFVNRRSAENNDLPRFAGWWGHDRSSRFQMPERFLAIPGAEGWQLSNPPILSLAPLAVSLQLFMEAGKRSRREKSLRMGAYLRYLLNDRIGERVDLLTPAAARARGAQMSLRLRRPANAGDGLIRQLRRLGIVADWRAPDILRFAPVPLYNSYLDIYRAVEALGKAVRE